MADLLLSDLKVEIGPEGEADIVWSGPELETVRGTDNLAQALTLRLLTHRGELEALGHPRYGSQVKELVGEPLDRENLDLLSRFVRKALEAEPRVEAVTFLAVRARIGAPGVVDIEARVRAITRETVRLALVMDFG